jgi:hypothetical protein
MPLVSITDFVLALYGSCRSLRFMRVLDDDHVGG